MFRVGAFVIGHEHPATPTPADHDASQQTRKKSNHSNPPLEGLYAACFPDAAYMKRTPKMEENLWTNDEAERLLLAASMFDVAEFRKAKLYIRTEVAFRVFAHQRIWATMSKLERKGVQPDFLAVGDELGEAGCKDIGGIKYLIDLNINRPPAPLIESWARVITTHHARRRLKQKAAELGKLVDHPGQDVGELLHKAKLDLEKISAETFRPSADEGEDVASTWIPFPLPALPASLQDYCYHAAEALRVDPAYIALPALVATAAAIGNSRVIRLKETWCEPCVCWGALIAESSTLKSPSLETGVAPIWKIQEQLSKEYDWDCTKFDEELATWEKSSKKGWKGEDSPKPVTPEPKRILISDITIEKLAEVLWNNPRGLVLVRDELSGWFGSFTRYSSGGGKSSSDLSTWLSIFRATQIVVDRKTGTQTSILVPRAAVSVIGTIQPGILHRVMTDEFFESGLTSRLLLAMPPRRAKVWSEDVIPPEVGERYHELLKRIYLSREGSINGRSMDPLIVDFGVRGKKAWIDFYDHWAEQQSFAEGEHASALSKLEAYCARFALMLAVVDKFDNNKREEQVNDTHVHRAFELVQWFAREAERVYRMVREPAAKRDSDRLIDFIAAKGGNITCRDLLRSNPAKYGSIDKATALLEGLASSGMGIWSLKTHEKGGRPVRTFYLKADSPSKIT